jgi:hypothetical protein
MLSKRVLILGFVIQLLAGCTQVEEEIFILPKDYRGYIIIIYNQVNGTSKKYEGSKRVYQIPENGILKTQFSTNDGWRTSPEFYYEKINSSTSLLFVTELEKVPNDKVVACGGTAGSVKKNEFADDRIMFVEYYVGTKEQIKKFQEEARQINILKMAE